MHMYKTKMFPSFNSVAPPDLGLLHAIRPDTITVVRELVEQSKHAFRYESP
jgi:hypothetical protein